MVWFSYFDVELYTIYQKGAISSMDKLNRENKTATRKIISNIRKLLHKMVPSGLFVVAMIFLSFDKADS